MNPRNAQSAPQRQHGSHSADCGCMKGHHIWDADYDKEMKGAEKFCLCCEHFFIGDEGEDTAANNSIEWGGKTTHKKPETKQSTPAGFSKGIIKRRS